MIEGQAITAAFDRHRFRGEFLDCFAIIETHFVPVLDRLVELGQAKKAPHLFGQKFDLVLRLSNLERLWLHRPHIGEILDELRPFVELRGSIAHALFTPIALGKSQAIVLQSPGSDHWQTRKVITEVEAASLIADLRKLTAKLVKQRLVESVIAPSSPPPPSQAAAVGP